MLYPLLYNILQRFCKKFLKRKHAGVFLAIYHARGYKVVGGVAVQCLTTGSFSAITATCEPEPCGNLTSVSPFSGTEIGESCAGVVTGQAGPIFLWSRISIVEKGSFIFDSGKIQRATIPSHTTLMQSHLNCERQVQSYRQSSFFES